MYMVKEALSMLFNSVMGPLEAPEAQKLEEPQKLVGIYYVKERECWSTPPPGIVVIGHGPWPSLSHTRSATGLVSYDLFILDSEYQNSEIVLLRATQAVLEGISQKVLDKGGNSVLNLIFTIDPFHTRDSETGVLLEAAGSCALLETMDEWMDRKYGLAGQS